MYEDEEDEVVGELQFVLQSLKEEDARQALSARRLLSSESLGADPEQRLIERVNQLDFGEYERRLSID